MENGTVLKLKRQWYSDKCTIGELFFDNSTERECYTLEDRVRDPGRKIPAMTAIEAGRYEVVVSYSNRFKKLLPLLMDVDNFQGVRIHSGNTDADTEGCILVGLSKDVAAIYESRPAFAFLFPKIQEAMHSGKLFIEITDEPVSDLRTVAKA